MADSKVITRNDVQNILAHINLGDDSHQEITQADFDALSDEEKNSGTIYFITNGTNNNIFLDDNTPIGTIAPYGGTSDPAYWLICDGRAISRTAYADLFTVIGTTYGEGDGETTFNIPDLRGRIAQGSGTIGNETYVLGDEVDAGLPNITGGFAPWSEGLGASVTQPQGAFYSTASNQYGWGTTTGRDQDNEYMNFDASRSSSIYGNSTTVQPNTVVTNYIIKASSALSEHQSQLDFFYPVGSYYETTSSNFNPNTNWGGTWELEANSTSAILEEGISGLWSWKKWSDGTLDIWYKPTSTTTLTNYATAGSYYGYYTTLTFANDMPKPINTHYMVIAEWYIGSGFAMYATTLSKSTTQFNVYALSNTSGSKETQVSCYIHGRWTEENNTTIKYKWHRVA